MSSTDLYRILIPSEYRALRDAVPKSKHRILVDCMLFTGMRYKELRHFAHFCQPRHERWFDAKNHAISLPEEYTKTGEKRTVHLTPTFSLSLHQYLREFKELDFPEYHVMNENLKRWWNDAQTRDGIKKQYIPDFVSWYPTVKTFRKTWESYLLASGYDYMAVCCSQGHSPQISYSYYANLDPRLKSCMDDVRKLTEGWMT